MTVFVPSEEGLSTWLKGKPIKWSKVVAQRAALRVVPAAINPMNWSIGDVNQDGILGLFRLLSLTTAACYNTFDREKLQQAVNANLFVGRFPDLVTNASFFAVSDACEAAIGGGSVSAQTAAAFAVEVANQLGDPDYNNWGQFLPDLLKLDEGQPVDWLLRSPIWKKEPKWFYDNWVAASVWLSESGDGFEIWREWYEGRIDGLPDAFVGFGDAANLAFYRWIVEQDNDWWEREPGVVNGEISAFVDGLRKPMQVQESGDTPISLTPDPQAEAAPTIARSEGNRLTLVKVAPEVNPSAQRRFERARARVEELLQFMESTNYGADFAVICETILQSLGRSLEELDGDGIVLDTDSLRVEFETQQNPGRADEWEPLTGKPKRLVSDAISALNLLIGSDGKLEARETIRLGPDAEREIAEPKATVDLADTLKKDDLIEPKADKAARQAAKNAPSPPDPNNRRTALVTELGLNFARWTINFIVEYEDELPNYAALAAGTGLIIDPLTTSAGIGLAWLLVRNVHQNREKWRTIAAQARVTKQNFERLLKIIDSLPLD